MDSSSVPNSQDAVTHVSENAQESRDGLEDLSLKLKVSSPREAEHVRGNAYVCKHVHQAIG